jgi:NAD(P)H-quinone oxidoreductase subunit 5
LTALNLTRVFRLVFLGDPQPKTRRAPEVPWPMAVPMVSLAMFTLLVPTIMNRMICCHPWEYINIPAVTVILLIACRGWLG